MDQEIWQDINRQMTSTAKLPKAMAVLLRMLQMNDGEDEGMQTHPSEFILCLKPYEQQITRLCDFRCDEYIAKPPERWPFIP